MNHRLNKLYLPLEVRVTFKLENSKYINVNYRNYLIAYIKQFYSNYVTYLQN